MTFVRNLIVSAAFAALVFVAAGSAQAGSPFGCGGGFGGGFGGCGGYGGLWNGGFAYNSPPYPWPFYQHSIPTPPYFSLHPPVYYSLPVPRTYGYSPYPYSGDVRTPEIEYPQPETIRNPHVNPLPEPAKPEAKNTGRVAAQIIINPFVDQAFVARSK